MWRVFLRLLLSPRIFAAAESRLVRNLVLTRYIDPNSLDISVLIYFHNRANLLFGKASHIFINVANVRNFSKIISVDIDKFQFKWKWYFVQNIAALLSLQVLCLLVFFGYHK